MLGSSDLNENLDTKTTGDLLAMVNASLDEMKAFILGERSTDLTLILATLKAVKKHLDV